MSYGKFLFKSLSLPISGELQINLFGAGVGESIGIHLPDDTWLLVDSFINSETKNPILLDFLNSLNVDLKKQVAHIVITHWHDDHIKGISKIISECPNARVWISNALARTEFLSIVELQKDHRRVLDATGTGVDEFGAIFAILAERKKLASGKNSIGWASSDRVIIDNSDAKIRVSCLSPSDYEFQLAIEKFAALVPKGNAQPMRVMSSESPNDTAVVLSIETANASVILGSDLEESTDSRRGWTAVLQTQTFPKGKINFFKVPHHGSENAHNSVLWDNHLEKNVCSLLSPFSRSHLPRLRDKERILNLSENAYIASQPTLGKAPQRNSTVEKIAAETLVTRRILSSKAGAVQIQLKPKNTEFSVSLAGTALPLKSFQPVK